MKLYYTPGTCSMAVHIALHEAGMPFDAEKVDLRAKRTAAGEDFLQVNPKGSVPALRLDDGAIITEVGTLLQYVADRKPESGLAPPPGTIERYRLLEWISFLATEIHKGFGPLWNPQVSDEVRTATVTQLGRHFDYVAGRLAGPSHLIGDRFSVADAYLFTLLGWTDLHKIDTSRWPVLQTYQRRLAARPAVRATLVAEGLVE